MSWDSFFASLDSLCQDAADFAGTSPRSVCRLLTADTDGILVADDSSMVSLIGIGGSLRLIGEEEFEKAAMPCRWFFPAIPGQRRSISQLP